jgi:hypothetical protein
VALLAASPSAQTPAPGVLSRVQAYVDRFQKELPSLVAEEHYVQDLSRGFNTRHRVLRSDLLMLSLPGSAGWVSFRDVFEVDSRAIRDREDRLLKLLQSPSADTLAQSRRLAEESARYNLGQVTRTTNVPDSALAYLQRSVPERVKFDAPRKWQPVEGIETVVIRFQETFRPTIVRTPAGANVAAVGRVWAHVETGAIVRTEITLTDRSATAVNVVDFAVDERLGLRVPVKMTERYTSPTEYVTATAQYSNFRRFSVATSEKVGKPPG